jgi:hypothetical protein
MSDLSAKLTRPPGSRARSFATPCCAIDRSSPSRRPSGASWVAARRRERRLASAFLLVIGLAWISAAPGCIEPFTSCTSSGTCRDSLGGAGGEAEDAPSEADGGGEAGGAASGGVSGSSDASTEAGSGGEGGVAGGGPGVCDPDRSPRDEACLVADEYAIFVAPSGKDQNAGTRAAPVSSLKRALALAGSAEGATRNTKRIIVCAAKFDEPVIVVDGLKLYGGFVCPGNANAWEYDATSKTEIAPSTVGPALEIKGVVEPVVIEDVAFSAADGTNEVPSSVAAFVANSASVMLRGVVLTAGKGIDGRKELTTGFTFPQAATLNGLDASGTYAPGQGNECRCPDGRTTRGSGGGSAPGQAAASGLPIYNDVDGRGGDPSFTCSAGGAGRNGAAAPLSGERGEGATSVGKITSSGWEPASGADAAHGAPGQGGGGGAGRSDSAGGGGGCGSCGGKGGPGGKGGGASIALLSADSTILLSGCQLVASDAGDGGGGSVGQPGQMAAGAGGIGYGASSGDGCPGGDGGLGSAGGNGGGGAGGVSAGIVYAGSPPERDAATAIHVGSAGKAGVGESAGRNDGVDGVAVDELNAESAE